MELPLALAAPFLLALLAPGVARLARLAPWLLATVPAVLTAFFITRIANIRDGETDSVSYRWVEALGIDFALRLDGLSLTFALLICGVGSLIVLYSGSYLKGHPSLGRFYSLLFLFMGAMLGLVLADNLITLFVFWELTSVTSFGLISFESYRPTARQAASQALFVTAGGGLALLAGLVLMGIEGGSFSISQVVAEGALQESHLYTPMLLLVLIGAFTKSAQFPFHFWLPNAMEAPTPVSAYLHSATMVKAGVYLLARFNPALGGTDEWFYLVSFAGGITMVVGAVIAIRETILKRILAYSTLSILGSLVFLLGIGSEEAVVAAMVLLLAHAGYKAALFLCAGIIDHATEERDIRRLGGLASAMPLTAACVVLAAISMAGLPPLLGFLAKESVYEAVQHAPRFELLALAAAFVANAIMVAVAVVLVVRPFFGRAPAYEHHPHEADVLLLAGPVVLVGFSLVTGLAPALVDSGLVATSSGAVLGETIDVSLKLWHGFNLTLGLSALTVAAGVVAYLLRDRLLAPAVERVLGGGLGPEAAYEGGMARLNQFAVLQTRLLQNGYLRVYVSIVLLAMLVAVIGTAMLKADLSLPDADVGVGVAEAAVGIIIMAGVLLAVTTDSRLTAIIALGMVGYGIALIYALFGAPDLAITQILVETLIVLLMVFAFYRLPRFNTNPGSHLRDAAIAITVGATFSVLLLTSLTLGSDRVLSNRLADMSKPEAHGSNIVNVILVDFRSLDTLGEITVLAVAGVGIVSLLKITFGGRGEG